MSQLITIKRMITVDDLEDVLRNYADLQVIEKHRWGCRVSYVPEPGAQIVFVNGEIQATSPGDRLSQRLEMLAGDLNGRLIHEEEEVPAEFLDEEGKVSSTTIFWPVISAVLLVLLIWRW